jgi:lysophospholipase L1-like esterase|tara:strand:- start:100 stop:723 length:624 start_codon:yes stop_codon:yes gene_type:complete
MSSCNGNKKQVVFLGDSITEAGRTLKLGFLNLIEESIDANKFNIIGKGISGDKVSDLLVRYEEDVLAQNPDIVFIYIGINDVWHTYDMGKGSDIDFYEKGLRKIITDIKNKGAKIILCTPTVIGEKITFEDELEIRRDQELDAFSGVVRNLASEFNTELLDLRTIFKDYIAENNKNNEYQDFLTVDGVHLNDAGNKLLSEKMLNYIN